MKKSRSSRSGNGETPLPESIIHHIQSFMSGKEAARTALVSKYWYNAWLTHPALDFDGLNFQRLSWQEFEEFTTKTMRRYTDSSLKIESFRLPVYEIYDDRIKYVSELIANAMKIGATDIHLELCFPLSVPQEVLGSQKLRKLSLKRCQVDGSHVIRCSNLKSLTLNNVVITSDDVLDNIISRNTSIEELSLSGHCPFQLRPMNLCELHKLRRLFLCWVDVGSMFSSDDFASRFPLLNDLSIHSCSDTNIRIASTSLRTISFTPMSGSWRAKFVVPYIRKFSYSASCLPNRHLSIKAAASREWEFEISIRCNQFYKSSWFLNLKKYLAKFRLSGISLSIQYEQRGGSTEQEVEAKVLSKPLVVENLMIRVSSS